METNTQTILIKLGNVELRGDLSVPEKSKGLIIFSHGSGSSRLSPRNKMVADVLQKNNFATLLFDLLTEEEDEIFENRFNIALLSSRLVSVTKWVKQNKDTKHLNLGYFGASTGAASALYAAAECGTIIKAVVSRGGRPDLAMEVLAKVKAPVLLIVGELDAEVIELNEQAFEELRSEKKLYIVPGATHLFEEEGKLEKVSQLASAWYNTFMLSHKEKSLN